MWIWLKTCSDENFVNGATIPVGQSQTVWEKLPKTTMVKLIFVIAVVNVIVILLKTIYEMIKHQSKYYIKWETGTVKGESRGNAFVP